MCKCCRRLQLFNMTDITYKYSRQMMINTLHKTEYHFRGYPWYMMAYSIFQLCQWHRPICDLFICVTSNILKTKRHKMLDFRHILLLGLLEQACFRKHFFVVFNVKRFIGLFSTFNAPHCRIKTKSLFCAFMKCLLIKLYYAKIIWLSIAVADQIELKLF